MHDDDPLLLEITEQTAGAACRMSAIGAGDAGVRRARLTAGGGLGEHQEHTLQVVGNTR